MARKGLNGRRPAKIDGYFRVGSRYIAGRVFAEALALVLAAGLLYCTLLHPHIMKLWYSRQTMPEFKLDSPWLADYSGQAKLLLEDGSVVYEGFVSGAVAQGMGTLYQNGAILYRGEFSENKFCGKGELYSEAGALIYAGDFADNAYNGEGILYDGEGGIVYSGGFEQGVFHGSGTQYSPGETYTGGFEQGARAGLGSLYNGDVLIYEGMFAGGMFNGFGKKYIGGMLAYEGDFEDGLYSGQGRLYSEGKLRYEGAFSSGMYEGSGKLYEGGASVYEGEFMMGLFSGNGTEYNAETGFKMFEGRYAAGERMAAGIYYDARGNPVSMPFDPVSLLDASYEEILLTLADEGITYSEQRLDSRHLLIDEAGCVIYALSLDPYTQEPSSVNEIYLCALYGVGGYIVGAEVDTSAADNPWGDEPAIGPAEELALLLSNRYWGRDAVKGDIQSWSFLHGGLRLTAYCLISAATEELESTVAYSAQWPSVEEEHLFAQAETDSAGKIVILKAETNIDGGK